MKYKLQLLTCLFLFALLTSYCQPGKNPSIKGKLFIIGGGDRSPKLMKTLLTTAQLKKDDYVIILPMSSEEPDTSFYYIRQDFEQVCSNTLANLNFTKEKINDKTWLDSLRKARLIFITGGDQNRFMNIVLHTPIQEAIFEAFRNGATIAGTSAGAAIMSKKMITGNEFSGDSVRSGSFKKIQYHLVEIKEGLGLIDNAIIDQHFIARSRYNRLLSVLAQFPSYPCIGIDEATAIIVSGKQITVAGESQVITFSISQPVKISPVTGSLVKMRDVHLNILTAGDVFMLK
ncbi:MAG: cyanophycinase [Ferruginibacter sp.]